MFINAQDVKPGQVVTFKYNNKVRLVKIERTQLKSAKGEKYIHGLDIDAGQVKNFSVSKIEGRITVSQIYN